MPAVKLNSVSQLRILLVYPNTSDLAHANLGFQRVYSLINRIEGVTCDRLCLPVGWKPEKQNLSRDELRSEDNGLMPDDFDIIAFSISFEPDYLNLVTQLKYFGMPLASVERNGHGPLIVAGGSAIFINPEPLADIIDLFFIGEAEQLTEEFFALAIESGIDDKQGFLKKAAEIKGIYVPRFYQAEYKDGLQIGRMAESFAPERVERHWVAEGSPDLCTHSEMHESESTFSNMGLMEVTRGCIWACRFCTAGFIYRPPRLPDLEATYDSLSKALEKNGQNLSTIGLVGPSVTDHPELMKLANRITEEGKTLSFSSLRMETLTDELMELIVASGQKTITVAVDGPSERMRNVINKAATDEFIIEKCGFLIRKGILHLKIYSIIGLPGEMDEDISDFIRLVENVQSVYVEESRKRGKIGKVTISLSPLTPKPGTPFQWHPAERVETLKKKFMRVRKALGKLPHIKLSFGSPHEAYLQTYLSRGDRGLINFFEEYLSNGHQAKQALKSAEPHPDNYSYRQYQLEDFLPWDIVDHGYHNKFLWQDYQRGLREKHTPICDTAVCKICGIC
jgi:radical SAM superfamily enzyme YgiQ (UPF0313 family)